MINSIKNGFKDTYLRYSNILNKYYPSHGSTGFTERNLTNNFVAAMEKEIGEDCISWFEAPISLDNKAHIDAVIFTDDSTILIEAKRFTSPESKVNSVKSDMVRMHLSSSIELLEAGLADKSQGRKRYSIVLADVWTENTAKRELFDNWPKCLSSDEFVYSDKISFGGLHSLGSWVNDYKLLIAVSEIKI
ncbi:hypothetical protein [Photobacterium kishitanii]|uniref:hypothetical protein n=1 Tax=Photobacterium kishitanii TaxID=318456 RepID=UPI000D17E527|nr:hypothetical protein [Photobacterium kishitanii]PSU23838.1 hypothetical protein CTM84_02720 [Photobacterium kishitanii]